MKSYDLDNTNIDLWCTYCKEAIKPSNGFVVKKGNTYHLECWKLLTEEVDEFGEPFVESEE